MNTNITQNEQENISFAEFGTSIIQPALWPFDGIILPVRLPGKIQVDNSLVFVSLQRNARLCG